MLAGRCCRKKMLSFSLEISKNKNINKRKKTVKTAVSGQNKPLKGLKLPFVRY
jgi:hypothetical protein